MKPRKPTSWPVTGVALAALAACSAHGAPPERPDDDESIAPLRLLRQKPRGAEETGAIVPDADREETESDAPEVESRLPGPGSLGEQDALDDLDRELMRPTREGEADPLDGELDRDLLGEIDELGDQKSEADNPMMQVAEWMRRSEGKLARVEADRETLALQERIVEKLEQLLEQSNQGKSGSKSSASQQQRRLRQQAPKPGEQQQRPGAQQPGAAQQGQGEPQDGSGRAQPATVQGGPQPETKAVWGHLSELMREEMNQYAREDFLAGYRRMIEIYYTEIARRSNEE